MKPVDVGIGTGVSPQEDDICFIPSKSGWQDSITWQGRTTLPFTYFSSWCLKNVPWFHLFPVHHPYWPRTILLPFPWLWLATLLALQPAYIIQQHRHANHYSVNFESNPSTLKTNRACSFETSAFNYKTTWYHNTKDHGMNNLHCRH
jgi:hypothetical protein